MPVTAGIYFGETPSATMKTEKSLRTMMKTRKLMFELQRTTLMLRFSSKVRDYAIRITTYLLTMVN